MNSSSMPAKRRLLYVSLWPWDGLWQRPQHLAEQLALQYDVVYVSALPFHSRKSAVAHLSWTSGPVVRKPRQGLTVVQFPLPPSWRFQWLREWNHERWAAQVASFLRREGMEVDVLWLSSPDQRAFLKKVRTRLVCYDCMDEFNSFVPHLALVEQDLFRRADITFVSASALEVKARRHTDRVQLVPNGVDVDHFRKALDGACAIPTDLLSVPGPRVGYYGSIADWLDYDILEALVESSDISLVLIGPVHSEKARALSRHARVFLLGTRPYSELPAYLAHLDVSILPFRLTELTRAVDPVKVYEYLAAGSDVVATPLPMLQRHAHLLRLATSAQFAEAVHAALLSPTTRSRRLERSRAMDAHSWKQRGSGILQLLAQHESLT